MTQIVTLHLALPDAASGAAQGVAPDWVHLVPAGTFRGVDGRGPYKLANPDAVITASMQSEDGRPTKLTVDVNHATDHAMRTGQDSPAQGWIVELQSRADGIWGRVDWCPSGLQLMAARAYRGVSPVIETTKAGVVLRVLRAALTNTPNLTALTTLHSQQENTLDIGKARAALGLPDTADEAAVIAAITANATTAAAHATQASDLVLNVAKAAGITATTPAALITELQARRATAVSPEIVTQLQSQLDTLKAQRAGELAERFIDGAIAAGKPIVAQRAQLLELHATNAEMVEKLVNAMPSLHAGGLRVERQAEGDDEDALSDVDMQTCKKMGLTPKAFAKQKRMARMDKEKAA